MPVKQGVPLILLFKEFIIDFVLWLWYSLNNKSGYM